MEGPFSSGGSIEVLNGVGHGGAITLSRCWHIAAEIVAVVIRDIGVD